MSSATHAASDSTNQQYLHHPLSGIIKTLGTDLFRKIQSSKILLVGSGGIGCELLKNLALSGFQHVQVIDLDTIDVSNLNRQFLFRSQHVGQPKCHVACQVVSQFMVPPPPVATTTLDNSDQPHQQYVPHHGNVCDNSQFNVQFVSQFDVVLNALDNVTARRRVNRLCLAANVPLVEAGTTGYLGQVNVIDKASRVACYECVTQETQKVYPICTIRSTPSMPVHTIVWAKELYKLLFGEKVEESMLYEATQSDTEKETVTTTSGGQGGVEEENHNKQNNENGKPEQGVNENAHDEPTTTDSSEPSTYMASIMTFRSVLHSTSDTNGTEQNVYQLAREVMIGLYVDEVQKQLQMGRYKTALKTPAPLNMDWIEQGTRTDAIPPTQTNTYKSTAVWSPVECVAEFTNCLVQATTTPTEGDSKEPLFLPSFDKDDALSMRFVTAASNLRNYVFDIQPMQSFYSAKGIAGNIIPAIATTNAICAGLQLLQVFHILRAQLLAPDGAKSGHIGDTCRYINCLRNHTRNGLYLTASPLTPPNPKCFVCRNATLALSLTTTAWTLQDLLVKVLKQELGFEQPTLMIEGDMIWEEGEGADSAFYTPNLAKPLPQLPGGGIQHGTVIRVEDFSQELEVDVCFHHVDTWPEDTVENEKAREAIRGDDPHLFIVGGDKPIVVVAAEAAAAVAAAAEAATDVAAMASDAAKETTTNGGREVAKTPPVQEEDDDDDDVIIVLEASDGKTELNTNESRSTRKKRARENDGNAEQPIKKPNVAKDQEVIEID